jgi:fructose-1,6-bisphosphatase/inositol monophosphatase family enzyme
MRQGWNCLNMRPDSAVCMALFEGPKFGDITVNVTTTMQGDVLSAIMESPERSVAYINNVRLAESDFQTPDLRLKDCQIDIMGNTNYNLAGIGALAEKLIRNNKYGEVRITSSGSSAVDIVNMIAGKMDAIVDLRALYKDSWANLEIADIASMYRFLKAAGFLSRMCGATLWIPI